MPSIVGIDPGQDVAVCTVTPGGRTVHRVRSPGRGVDEGALCRLLALAAPQHAYIEWVGVMPGQGATSGSTFMVAWGVIRGICCGLGVPYTLVTPQSWKRRVLAGRDMGPPVVKGATKAQAALVRKQRKDAQKAAAVAYAQERYPGLALVLPGCRVPNHNLAEAVCIADYGLAEQECCR